MKIFSKIMRNRYRNFDIYKPCNVNIDKNSNIDIDGFFNFNLPCTLKNKNYLAGELIICKGATLKVKGCFSVYSGSSIAVNEGASLVLGNGYINQNSKIRCREKIVIGDGTIISENVHIRDSDTHTILNSNHIKTKPVYIGKNVWIGVGVTILKGVTIGGGSIIGAGSVVTKNIPAGCLVAGNPAKVIRENIEWK